LDEKLEKLRTQKRWSDVIRTLLAQAEIHVDAAEKVALFREAGALYVERSSNQAEAIKCFEQVLEYEPEDAEAIERLKEMYEKRRDWESLIRIMEREALLLDPEDRPLRYAEMAELATKRIRKPDVCIALWEKVREAEPTHPEALASLASLYERARDWAPLAAILEQLTEADPDPKQLQKLGSIYADKLDDDEGAIRAFKALLTLQPDDRRAQEQLKRRYVALKDWEALEDFYGASGRWDELIRILEREADGQDTAPDDRVALLFRAAGLWLDKNGKADRAARAYEKIFQTDPDNLQAAEALSPIYEEAGDARRLAPVYEVRLRQDLAPDDRVALLRATGRLYEEKLRQPQTAYAKVIEAFRAVPTDPSAREDAARLAAAVKDWDPLTEAYEEAIADAAGDESLALRMDFAELLRGIDRGEEAIAQYVAVLDVQPDHPGAIAAVTGLYEGAERWADMRQVLERRMEIEGDPERRRELAYQRATLLEERLDDAPEAMAAYEGILAEYGDDEADAFRALDRLYEAGGRWEDLEGILERRVELGPASNEELAALKFRQARVLASRMNEPERAVELYREVLLLVPEHEGARDALEELLGEPAVAMQAARILEPLYEEGEAWGPLIRTLRVLHAGTDAPEERLDLLTKIGEIHAERLGRIDEAFAAFGEALREQPGEAQSLARLENLAIAHERFPPLVELLGELASQTSDPELSRTLWVKCATVQDVQLEDTDGAVASYRKVLAESPGDDEVLVALDALFRRTERWSDLAGVLRRRAEQTLDGELKEELLGQMATLYDVQLGEPETAIGVHREILELDPASPRALAALDDLFARQEMWSELADNVDRQLELAEDPERRTELMLQLAQLRETRMNAPDAAIEIYREVLDRDPTQRAARASLERLLESEAHQVVIAEVLEPIYRDQGEIAPLIGIHEIQARHASAPERRVELLHRIAELYEQALGDGPKAFDAYSRALREDPSSTTTQEQLERLSGNIGDAEQLATTYEAQVEGALEPQVAADLLMKAAQIREERLGDHDKAIVHYTKVLELDDTRLEAAESLERLFHLGERYEELASITLTKASMLPSIDEQKEALHRAARLYEDVLERPADAMRVHHQVLEVDGEDMTSIDKLIELNLRAETWQPLLEVYTRKADIVFDPVEKKRLYVEVGTVYEQELKEPARAIDSYQRILEIDPDDYTALSRLDQLYQTTESWQDLMSVLERQADLAPDDMEVLSYRYRIAELWHHRLGEPLRAVDIYRDILDVQPTHAPTLAALEALIAARQEPLAAAAVLEPAYEASGEVARLVAVHEVQVAHEEDPLRQVELLHRIADLQQHQLANPGAAFDAYARALPLDSRHDHTLASLERLAEGLGRWPEVAQLYDVETGRLTEERPDDVVDLALRAARLYEAQLGDVPSAIARYALVTRTDPAQLDALEALDRLYLQTEQWAELAGVLEREVELAASPDAVLEFQYRLGQLQEQRLGDVPRAIALYEAILSAAPEHTGALHALEAIFSQGAHPLRVGEILEPLYRLQESWDKLLTVQEVQLVHQDGVGERVERMHRLAELAEERAFDHERAFLWMQKAILEDPSHDHSLAEAERLAEPMGGWRQLAGTYADGIARTEDAAPRVHLGKRLARVYEEELGDVARAEEAYRFVIGVDARDEDALLALDRLYTEAGAHEALASALQLRIEASDLPADLVDLHYRRGKLLEVELGRVDEAVATYRHVLAELEPEHAESVRALQHIYLRQGDFPALYGALEKELDVAFGDTARADIQAKMARLASDQLGEEGKAIGLWKQVLDLRGEDPEALNALGTLYAKGESWADLVEVLEREASVVDDDAARMGIFADLGHVWYAHLDRSRNALDNWERILDVDPQSTEALTRIAAIYRDGNQHTELVDTLHRLVNVGATLLEEPQLEAVFMELGQLYDAQLEQPMDAADAYVNALDIRPGNHAAIDALESIHRREEMWEEVTQAKHRRVAAHDDVPAKVAELEAIAAVWAEQLDNADGATPAFQEVLRLDPLNARAFANLEALHGSAERWGELIELYVERVEATDSRDDRIELLVKTAGVYEEKLDDKIEAFDALSMAWSLDYTREATAENLERIARDTQKWNELLNAANAALQSEEDPEVRIALCLQCARWYGQELGHPEYAIPYFEQIRQLDPGNVPAMVSMADLYEATQQWDALAQTLGQVVTMTSDAEIQASTYVRMGDLARTRLNVPEQAGGYYQKALDVDAVNVPALEALERIHRQDGQWDSLIDVLRRKADAVDDPQVVVATRLALAEALEDHSADTEQAIATFRGVSELDTQNLEALKGLERLYARTERWPELRDVLELQFDVVSTEKERIEILQQLAGMWEEEFRKPDKAAECFEKIVEIDPMHEAALAGAARLYRQLQDWDRVVDTYERHIAATPDRGTKVQLYKAMGETYARDRDDADRAVDAYLAVLDIDEQETEAMGALAHIYEKREEHSAALEMMEQLARLEQDPAKQVDLLHRSGRILETELSDRSGAMDRYQMAIDLEPGHLPSLAAMRALYMDEGDWLAACKLLEQEASYQSNPRLVSELLVELGRVYEERLDEHEQAVEVWERALQQDPDNEDAALPLAEEYQKAERWSDAFPLLDMLVKRSGKREADEQHRLAFELGSVASRVGEKEDAIRAFERANELRGEDLPTMLGFAGAYYDAAEWTEAFGMYQQLLVHHREALSPEETVDLFYRLGVIKREQGERRKALNMFDKALEEDAFHAPTLEAVVRLHGESEDWQQVIHFKKQLLEVAPDEEARFTLLDEIGELWKAKLDQPQQAVASWSAASDLRPDDHRILHKLLGAFQETRQWEPAIGIIQQISALDERTAVKAKYAYTIAVITRDELKDIDLALQRFNEALDLDPDQLKAFEAINKILNAKKDWKALERAYRKMI
ncbi:MAG: tetratricopeptide repeat protein, partial [Myxococcota bacterium]